jgi:hypothetical protein
VSQGLNRQCVERTGAVRQKCAEQGFVISNASAQSG